MFRRVLFTLLLLGASSASAAAPARVCGIFLAAMQDGVPVPSLPPGADLSPEDAVKAKAREFAVSQSVAGDGWRFWDIFNAVAEREAFFSLRASALFAASYDEEAGRWIDDDDGRQFWIYSSRALVDQYTLLSFADFHVENFYSEETAETIDETLQSFLENVRRRLVLMGVPDARFVTLWAQTPDGIQHAIPSLQWDLPKDLEKREPYLPFLGRGRSPAAESGVVLALSPRFHAQFVVPNHTWHSRVADGRELYVLPWAQFINEILGGFEIPVGTKQLHLHLRPRNHP